MTMSNSLIAQDSTIMLILCPFLSELWKCSVCTAAAGGNELYLEHGEWRLIPNQPDSFCREVRNISYCIYSHLEKTGKCSDRKTLLQMCVCKFVSFTHVSVHLVHDISTA